MLFAKGTLFGIVVSAVAVVTWWATALKSLPTMKMDFIILFMGLAIGVAVTENAVRAFSLKPPNLVARFFVGAQAGVGLAAALALWGVHALVVNTTAQMHRVSN